MPSKRIESTKRSLKSDLEENVAKKVMTVTEGKKSGKEEIIS